jgi:hypothetical protein
MIDCDEKTLEYMGSFLGLIELIPGATKYYLVPMLNEQNNEVFQIQQFGPAIDQGDVVNGES